ncbi:MAG TPA: hypothetical protein VKU19_27865 [Bryobacteraceae bacterium]|nr:hypothetical protein [Bryobacteraceae bacterium]
MARETKWDLTLGLAGVVYLALELFMGIDAPIIGGMLVLLAVCALVRPHRAIRRDDGSRDPFTHRN